MGTLRPSSEKASRQYERVNLRRTPCPQPARCGLEGRAGGANIIDEKDPTGTSHSTRREGPSHVPPALVWRKVDLGRRVARPSQPAKQNRHVKGAPNALREERGLVIPAPTTATPMKRHRHHSVDLARPLDRDFGHQRAKRAVEIAPPPILEPMDRIGDRPTISKDSARGRSSFEERLTGLAEDGSTELLTPDATRGSNELNEPLEKRMHPPTSTIGPTRCVDAGQPTP
jgi:hypothetical protein